MSRRENAGHSIPALAQRWRLLITAESGSFLA